MPARTPIVAGNWKMNTTFEEGLALVDAMLPKLLEFDTVDRVLCPPFISLAVISEQVKATGIEVGAQNVHPEPKGAFTGEVSVGMIAEVAKYVIVGHSERRQYFAEDDAFVNRKVKALLAAGLTPIMCVGETLAQNEAAETEAVVTRQVRGGLDGVSDVSRVVIAYEPIWAIGTGRAATAAGANATCAIIRRVVGELEPGADAIVRIQYGGSVTPENFAELIAQPDIDGALVGGASLKADSFVELVRIAAQS